VEWSILRQLAKKELPEKAVPLYSDSEMLHSQAYPKAYTPPHQDQFSAHYIPQQLSGESPLVPMFFELPESRVVPTLFELQKNRQ
jgi:hypothetical protein